MTFDFIFFVYAFRSIIGALPLTLLMTLLAVFFSFFIGVYLTVIRTRKVFILHYFARAYISVIRGTPAVLHLMIVSLAVPMLIDVLASKYGYGFNSSIVPLFVFAVMALSITAGAYMSEIIRAGILSVPQGQVEAAQAVGMSSYQLMYRIVLPQAAAASLPSLCNLFVGVLHGSSLSYLISVREITGTAIVISSREWKFLESYAAVAVLYWLVTLSVERIAALVEQRWKVRIGGGIA